MLQTNRDYTAQRQRKDRDRSFTKRRLRYYRPRTLKPSRPLRDKVTTLSIKLQAAANPLTSTTVADGSYAWGFRLNDLPDVAYYSAIWDQYRFNQITAMFYPITNSATPGTSNGFAPICVCVDFDDSTALTNYDAALQYDNSFIFTPSSSNSPYIRRFTPAVAIGAYDGTNFTNKVVKKYQWIDVAYPNTYSYGLKAVVKQQATTNLMTYYLIFICSVSFRSVR